MKSRAHHTLLFIASVAILLALTSLGGQAASSATGALDTPPAQAERSGQPLIRLQFATFDPLAGEPAMPAALRTAGYPGDAGPYIVQFEGPVMEHWRDGVLEAGAQIEGYIPDFAFLVRMDSAARQRVSQLSFVRWVGIFQPGYKMSPALSASPLDLYRLTLASWADIGIVVQHLAASGLVATGQGKSLVVNARYGQLSRIARLPDVLWIEEFRFFEKQNDVADGIMNAVTAWTAGYNGSGQLVTIADTGLDTGVDASTVGDIHLDFDNRVAHFSSTPVVTATNCIANPGANDGPSDVDSGHGTHVAGSVAGNGARSSGLYKGPAFAATFTFQAIEQFTAWTGSCAGGPPYALTGIPDDLNDLFQEAYDWGSRIHSNSWGSDANGAYDTSSQQVDQFAWQNKDFLALFAAGNAGVDANADGYVDINSMGSPATAKNAISVGASENLRGSGGFNPGGVCSTYGSCWPSDYPTPPTSSDPLSDTPGEMAAFSSRGPTEDGRIKPDVVAPGTNILSTRSSQISGNGWGAGPNAYYMYLGGTSMATPLAAGAATVVRDYLVDGEGIPGPSSALVKAILINSAVEINGYGNSSFEAGQPIPNPHEGWGRIDLAEATDGTNRTLVDDQALGTGTSHTRVFTVTSSADPLKVSLVWSDYPGNPAVSVQLVNNLDLRLTAPDGVTTYRGNRFSGGWSTSGGVADAVNNVENVYIQSPAPGPWEVEVIGFNVPQGPQPYALVINGSGILGGPPNQLYLPMIIKTQPAVTQFVNSDFESGRTGWTEHSFQGFDLILSLPDVPVTHGGSWAAWLGGAPDEIAYVEQQITVPPSAPHLSYWLWIDSQDTCGFDFGGSIVNGTTVVDVYDLCTLENTGGWLPHSVDLSAYAGQSVSIQIRAETDEALNSNLFVDDVSFQATAAQETSAPPANQPELIWRKSGVTAGMVGNDQAAAERLLTHR